ncbi:FmdB family zinc ribbon protein [Olsenella uli]|uniref:FmdB family zinc ribbon protein n=1 Tax=Olsenella uli TaxID=133926 RepID=UPI0012ABA0F8|nr:FmdB family zinc ribbon protein [Olsenella uli]
MARYDYKCTSCDKVFEVEHPMSERPHITCPNCGADAERVFEPSGISFKGSGFYNTDQRGGSSSTAATSAPSESSTASAAPSNDACAGCEHCASK